MSLELSGVWLIVTAVYAVTALVGLVVVIAGGVYLGLKVRRLVKEMKAAPKRVREGMMGTWGRVRERGTRVSGRGRRSWEASAASVRKVGEVVRKVGLLGGE